MRSRRRPLCPFHLRRQRRDALLLLCSRLRLRLRLRLRGRERRGSVGRGTRRRWSADGERRRRAGQSAPALRKPEHFPRLPVRRCWNTVINFLLGYNVQYTRNMTKTQGVRAKKQYGAGAEQFMSLGGLFLGAVWSRWLARRREPTDRQRQPHRKVKGMHTREREMFQNRSTRNRVHKTKTDRHPNRRYNEQYSLATTNWKTVLPNRAPASAASTGDRPSQCAQSTCTQKKPTTLPLARAAQNVTQKNFTTQIIRGKCPPPPPPPSPSTDRFPSHLIVPIACTTPAILPRRWSPRHGRRRYHRRKPRPASPRAAATSNVAGSGRSQLPQLSHLPHRQLSKPSAVAARRLPARPSSLPGITIPSSSSPAIAPASALMMKPPSRPAGHLPRNKAPQSLQRPNRLHTLRPERLRTTAPSAPRCTAAT